MSKYVKNGKVITPICDCGTKMVLAEFSSSYTVKTYKYECPRSKCNKKMTVRVNFEGN